MGPVFLAQFVRPVFDLHCACLDSVSVYGPSSVGLILWAQLCCVGPSSVGPILWAVGLLAVIGTIFCRLDVLHEGDDLSWSLFHGVKSLTIHLVLPCARRTKEDDVCHLFIIASASHRTQEATQSSPRCSVE